MSKLGSDAHTRGKASLCFKRLYMRAYQLDPALAAAKTNIDELVKQLPDGAETVRPKPKHLLIRVLNAVPHDFSAENCLPSNLTCLRSPALPIPHNRPRSAPPSTHQHRPLQPPSAAYQSPSSSPPTRRPRPPTPHRNPPHLPPTRSTFLDPLAHLVNLDDFPDESRCRRRPARTGATTWSPYHWQNSARGT
ncbi:hypothetical protein EWM64_g10373, partial [Hericium alpestre]